MQLGAAAVVVLPYLLLTGGHDLGAMTGAAWVLLLVMGVVHTGMAYTMYFGGLQGLSAQTAALFSYLDPVIAVVLSAVLLKEPMDFYGVVGAVLILGSALYSERMGSRNNSGERKKTAKKS